MANDNPPAALLAPLAAALLAPLAAALPLDPAADQRVSEYAADQRVARILTCPVCGESYAHGDEFTCDCGERYMVSDGDENDAPYLVRMEEP